MKRGVQWSLSFLLFIAVSLPWSATAARSPKTTIPSTWPLSSLTAWGEIYNSRVAPLGYVGGASQPSAEELAAKEWELIYLTNLKRRENGLPPLKFNPRLREAALQHSQDMADNNFFSHTGSDGSTLADRIRRAGYTGWQLAGENIAAGFTEPWALLYSWMQSDHRLNILSVYFNEIGIGLVYDPGDTFGPYYYYWTQDFGMRNTVYPVIINNEAYRTDSAQVSLYLYGTGYASAMQISNYADFHDATWQPFQSALDWTLLPGNGVRTVYVRLRHDTTIVTAQDSILLGSSDAGSATPAPTVTATPLPTNTPTPKATFTPSPTATPKATPSPVPTVTLTPTPTPDTADAMLVNFGITHRVLYTRQNRLRIHLEPPDGGLYAQVSDHPDFAGAKWNAVGQDMPWQIQSSHSIDLTLYARYWLENSATISPVYSMTIGYDNRAPWGNLLLNDNNPADQVLLLPAHDDFSGVAKMQIGPLTTLTNAPWLPYSATYAVSGTDVSDYAVRYRDRAGNVSSIVTIGSSVLSQQLFLPWASR